MFKPITRTVTVNGKEEKRNVKDSYALVRQSNRTYSELSARDPEMWEPGSKGYNEMVAGRIIVQDQMSKLV